MKERLLITFMIIVFFGAVLMLLKRRQIALADRASEQMKNKQTNMPTIVYFWSDGCSVCKKTQRPIIEEILAEYGKEKVALTSYNIDEAVDVAKEWGVRTLPTTFLLDSTGTIKHVNNGLVISGNLRKQLEPMIFQHVHSE